MSDRVLQRSLRRLPVPCDFHAPHSKSVFALKLVLFSLDQFSLNLVGLSTIFSQRPQQIGENLLCKRVLWLIRLPSVVP